MSKIHDLRSLSHEMVYDMTQCSDEIKSGDVLVAAGGVLVFLDRAWPVTILGESEVFHKYAKDAAFTQGEVEIALPTGHRVQQVRASHGDWMISVFEPGSALSSDVQVLSV